MEDRSRVLDYTKPVKLPYDCNKIRKNFTQGYFDREIGRYKNSVPSEFQWAAEDKLINKNSYEELKCQIPDSPRSTFLMVFSPDGKKVASTHGNHNVYVTDLTTGKNIQTLSGHPRTPWCIAFHPSSNQILASGCLGGQVRVWDLHGGSEVWTAESQTVIASLAFHPVDRMLVIATYNELHFWDWSQPEPFAKCSTKSEREKVRYVSFDRLGSKLITGIANPVSIPSQRERITVVNSQPPATSTNTTNVNSTPPTTVTTVQASNDQGRSITFCYRHLMNQYNQLVNRYFDLSRSRVTPTMDRGTDPMDLLDLRTGGSSSEGGTSNPSPSTSNSNSNSQTNSSSPLRFKITRSACRSYRPLSSRERYRIHSSVVSRLRSRSSLLPSSFASSTSTTTTSTTTASQNSTFTTPPSVSTPGTLSSSSSRGRRYGFSLAPTSRSWCLALSPESSSSSSTTRTVARTTVSSEALTNLTYTPFSNRAIFSTREINSNNSERPHFSVQPYRLLFNESDDNSPPRRTPPSANEDGFVNPSTIDSRSDSSRSGPRTWMGPLRRELVRQNSERSRSPDQDSTTTVTSSETVTNPTYTSSSDRSIFSTRESSSNNSERPQFSVQPYRLLFIESDDNSPPRRTPPSANEDSFVNPSTIEFRSDSSRSGPRGWMGPFRRDFVLQQLERSRSPNRDSTLHSPNDVEVERELQRPVPSLFLRRQDLESSRDQLTTPRQASSSDTESSSNTEFSRNVGHSSTFYLTPMDLRNVSPVRRFREDANSNEEPTNNRRGERSALPQSLMHPRPVPRFQVRSRLLQEPQSQLRLITNRETHGLNLQNNQSLRRQLSFRPGGQFVLSRHSNSPFQPRTPHHIDNPTPANSPTSLKDTKKSLRPEIPSVRSSFTTSISPSTNSPSSSTPSSSGNGPGGVASNLSFTGEGTSRQIFDQINRRLFDRVKIMIRDRIQNSSDNASTDSTVNYSRISGESEMDTRNPLENSTESEENAARGLGPRGADPLLSSASETLDISNDTLLLSNSDNSSPGSGIPNGTLSNGNRLNQSELLDPWESESEVIPLSLPINDVLNEQTSQETQTSRNFAQENSTQESAANPEQNQTSSSSSSNNFNNVSAMDLGTPVETLISSPETSMRHGIQLLSFHIENMQRLCWARIEILQLQKIRRMWEDLTKQIRHFHNTIQNRNRGDGSGPSHQNDNSHPNGDTPSTNDLGGDEPRVTASTSRASTSADMSNDDGINGYEELVESITNELFRENLRDNNSSGESESPSQQPKPSSSGDSNNKSSNPSTSRGSTNETEEPQPGPSGLSTPSPSRYLRDPCIRGERLKFRVYKILLDTIQKTRKRRDAREGGSSSSNEPQRQSNHFRMRNSSRPRFRSQRQNRTFGPSTFRSRTLSRELEMILQAWKNEKISSRSSQPTPSTSTSDMNQPSTSSSRPSTSTSTDACLSCGQKKKPTKDLGRQKRRNSDSSNGAGSSGSASKVLKNNVGERSEVPSREEPNVTNSNSSDHDNPSTSGTEEENSTNELLRQMIQTMETMLRFQREAFHRAEELARARPPRQHSFSLLSSSPDDPNNDQAESSEGNNLPRSFRSQRNTEKLIVSLMRDVTPLRAKRLLGYMLKSLTQFFGENFNNLNQVVGEQIFSLYMLLHLALELTDLLLDQLRTRSRDLERTWAVDNVNSSQNRERNFLLSRPSTASGLSRERNRSVTRSFQNSSLSIGREDSQRSRGSSSYFMRSHSRLTPMRLGSSTSTNTGHNRSDSTPSNYLRRRRVCARLSTAFPFGWHRYSRTPAQSNNTTTNSSSSGRGVNTTNLTNIRNFRFDRRNSREGQSHSGNRTFECEINNNNNNNSNNNNNNNNNNRNDSNNNLTLNNNRNNDINSNIVNNSNRNSNSDSNNNSNGYRNNASSSGGNNNNNNSNNNNNNSNVNSNFLNYYFPSSGSSNNSDNSNSNNIIIVTSLNSSNDLVNNSSNNSSYGGSRNTNSEGNNSTNSSRQGRSSSPFLSQNPLPPLRSMEMTLSRNENGDLSLRDERPIFWIRYGGNNEVSASASVNDSQSRVSGFTVPVVQVNDVPVSDVSMLNQPRHRPQSPVSRVPEDIWRWRAWRPRFLHPRYSGPNPFDDQDSNDVSENIHYYRILSTSAGSHLGVYALDPMIITDAPLSPHHRIQAWDFSQMNIPDISDREANGVVPECKIHNDASVDVSNDGHLLVTLLPSGRHSVTTMLGVYSLDWNSLGQLLYRTSFEQSAVSVSLSPTNRHLLVGLASRPVVVRDRMNMAQIFRLEGGKPSPNGDIAPSKRGRLVHMRDLEQTRETTIMSLNCIRWAPGAGQGLVYGTNTGQLKVLR